jgi:hypothetical protein
MVLGYLETPVSHPTTDPKATNAFPISFPPPYTERDR